MKLLYISTLLSDDIAEKLSCTTKINIHNCAQKFNRLVASGFVKNNVSVTTLSIIPISRSSSKKLCWHIPSHIEKNINFKYIPFLNIPIFRHLCLFFYSFFFTLFWGIKYRKENFLVCDALNISTCMGSLLASKIIGLPSMGIVTDLPGLTVGSVSNNKHFLKRIIGYFNKSYLASFSCYVFLTEQMNHIINTKHRPYIVMEGLVDEDMVESISLPNMSKNEKKILLYAGGLHERYGLKMLVEAFMQIKDPTIELWLYGDGPFVPKLKEYCKQDYRILYHGIVPNEQVVQAELTVTLLVNPRPTTEEFTQYSFPSKNMEYMVSGTPVLTTCLPGMPTEYYPYVYLFEEETLEGVTQTIRDVLLQSPEQLQKKGLSAKQFVLKKKNNVIQTKRMIDLLKTGRIS